MFDEKKVVELLIKLCSNKNIFSPENFKEASFFKISQKGSVFLSEDDISILFQIVNELNRDKYISDNFGTDFLKDNILEIIITSCEIDTNELKQYLVNKIKALYQNLKLQIKEHLYIFPIENLKLKRKFVIGEVSFYPYTNTRKKYIRSKIWGIIKNNPHYDRKGKSLIINHMIGDFEKSLKNTEFSLAEVNCIGRKGPAEQVALRKIRMAISALKLYSFPVDDSHQRYFGIVGEIIRGTVRSNFDFVEESDEQMNKITGYLVPFEIDKQRKRFMKDFEFGTLNKIIGKSYLNDFEQHLLTAVFWFGYAMNIQIFYEELKKHQKQKEGYENIEYFNLNQRFFYLFISIESLLKIKNEKQYTNKIKDRISKIVSKDTIHRTEILTKLDDYFKKRGEIAHQGIEYISLEKLIDMTLITQYCIFQTLKILKKKSFEEHIQFIQYIEGL